MHGRAPQSACVPALASRLGPLEQGWIRLVHAPVMLPVRPHNLLSRQAAIDLVVGPTASAMD